MTDMRDWQGRTGESWAREWSRTDRSFSALTDRLLGVASRGGFRRALDIGCGAGEVSLALARGHGSASVHGLDVSDVLITVARERGAKLGNVSFELADAADWRPASPAAAPDLLVSRHGTMFFDAPERAFAHLNAIAAPSARLVFSCFRSVSQNPWASGLQALLPKETSDQTGGQPHNGGYVPGPFAFADGQRLRAILEGAGWRDVDIEPCDYPYVAGAGEEPVEDALSFFLSIGPAARAASRLSPDARSRFVSDLRRLLGRHRDGGIVVFRAAAWLVTASAPS